MDFFKSVFSGGEEEEQAAAAAAAGLQGSAGLSPPGGVGGGGGGGFGGLMKTLASRSESAIQTCRRDLGEFGTGLLKETAVLREAIRDLPSSLGAGAAVAPEPLESVRRGATEIVAEGKQAGDARANLVKSVISSREEEEEDLSWEVDDDDGEEAITEEQEGRKRRADKLGDGQERGEEEATIGGSPVENPQKLGNMAEVASSATAEENVSSETKEKKNYELDSDELATKLDDRILLEGDAEPIVPCMDSGASAMPSQPSIPEEDDLGWDEIEDLGDDDEKKVGVSGGGPCKIDLRKRLSAAEEDEDLSWDIEDDEPINP